MNEYEYVKVWVNLMGIIFFACYDKAKVPVYATWITYEYNQTSLTDAIYKLVIEGSLDWRCYADEMDNSVDEMGDPGEVKRACDFISEWEDRESANRAMLVADADASKNIINIYPKACIGYVRNWTNLTERQLTQEAIITVPLH